MNYIEEFEKWKKISYLSEELKKELKTIENDDEAKKNQFSYYVEFGTAGMRGTMGVGPNRMNNITVRRTTLGLAKYIKQNGGEKKGVVIVYDTRNHSKDFASYIAEVLSEFGINVYLSKGIRPTPFLSFAVREMKAFAGINITASHNRKEDNGYKIYLQNGAQFSYPDDQKIINLVNEVTEEEMFVDPKITKINKKLINSIPKKVEDKFLKLAYDIILHKDFCKKYGKELKVVYTPLHGTGYVFLKDGFKMAGFTKVSVVKSQNDECGDFKTISYPNPETAAAFELAIKQAKKEDADIVVANDPDADRMGVYVKVAKGEYLPLTGNELCSVLFEYIAYFNKKKKDLTNTLAVKSFVTTRLIDAIADRYGINFKVTPTGFKWIGRVADESDKEFLIGAEESYGCALSDYVMDKDAIGTTLFVLEVALVAKKAGYTLIDLLKLLHSCYGVYKNYAFSIAYEGVSGKEKMAEIMKGLRSNPFKKLTDIKVIKIIDYITLKSVDMVTNIILDIDFPKNDTIKFFLEDNTEITIRPSGTEPKIKIYFDVVDITEELAENKIKILESAIRKILI